MQSSSNIRMFNICFQMWVAIYKHEHWAYLLCEHTNGPTITKRYSARSSLVYSLAVIYRTHTQCTTIKQEFLLASEYIWIQRHRIREACKLSRRSAMQMSQNFNRISVCHLSRRHIIIIIRACDIIFTSRLSASQNINRQNSRWLNRTYSDVITQSNNHIKWRLPLFGTVCMEWSEEKCVPQFQDRHDSYYDDNGQQNACIYSIVIALHIYSINHIQKPNLETSHNSMVWN